MTNNTQHTETRVLEWDTTTGKPPQIGTIIMNGVGDYFKVIARKGNSVTLKLLENYKI